MELEEVYSRFHEIKGLVFSRKRGISSRFGDHKSRFRGAGFEFADIEQWRPGEALTGVSWKLSLRNFPDKIFKIRRMESKEIPVDFLIDLSPSMRFQISEGSNRGRLLLELIGLLGFTSIDRQDPVGAVGFAEGIEFFLRPRATRGRIFYIAKKVYERMALTEATSPLSGPADFNLPLRLIYKKFKFRHLVFILSDFVDVINDPGIIDYGHLKKMASRHHVIALILNDPEEFNWRRTKGIILVRNPETGQWSSVKGSKAAEIRQNIAEKKAKLAASLKESGADVLELTHDDYLEKLVLFAGRKNVFH